MSHSPNSTQNTIGVLALQGDFDAHRTLLETRLHTRTQEVRTAADLAAVDALILPGGESTTIVKLMQRFGLFRAIQERAASGLPIYGTCAGLILLAKTIECPEGRPEQPSLGLLDITVARNAFGRQINSFEAEVPFTPLKEGERTVRGVFIRAPYVKEAGPEVGILSHFEDKIVAVRQGNLLATAFHPELTDDFRVHAYFLEMLNSTRE